MPVASLPTSRSALVAALAVGACAAVLLVATSPQLPITWDEGEHIRRAEQAIDGLGRADGGWSAQAISRQWEFTTQHEGHPAGIAWLVAVGKLFPGLGWGPLTQYRLGPMLLFGLAAGAVFFRLAVERGWTVAIVAVAALLSLPRMFAQAHLVALDGTLTAAWLLAWASFPTNPLGSAREMCGFALLWGIALGLTVSMKFTGWLAVAPFVAWCAVYSRRRTWTVLLAGIGVALATFYLFNPPLWHGPLSGVYQHFAANLGRAEDYNITGYFLGRYYDMDHSLPWYNTLVWTAVTVPAGLLLLSVLGLPAAFRPDDDAAVESPAWRRYLPAPAAALVVLNWLTLMVVRSLPGAPPHDGVRLFLPAFGFLAVLCGYGAGWLRDFLLACERLPERMRRAVATGALALILLGSASSVWWYYPHTLSYYSLLAGGLPGATELGMEPTYWWDALDDEALAWLHKHTEPEEKIAFAPHAPENLRLLKAWDQLDRGTSASEPGRYRWYVLQYRPSAMDRADWYLLEQATPAYRGYIRPPEQGWGPWRLDVPILLVYRYEQFEAAQRAVAEESHHD